jgi:hypothetical protein
MIEKTFQRPEVTSRYSTVQMIADSPKLRSNIRSVIAMATSEEYSSGIGWYELAHRQCQVMADHFGISLSIAVGVVAALSPGVQWEKNILDAIAVLEVGSQAVCSTYGANKDKAVSIASDGDVGVLGGSKVTAFYSNILNPHLDNNVTCDRHAAVAAANWYKEFDNQKFLGDPKYAVLEAAYFSVARELGIKGHQAQAIAWVTAKRLFSDKTDAVYEFPSWLPTS